VRALGVDGRDEVGMLSLMVRRALGAEFVLTQPGAIRSNVRFVRGDGGVAAHSWLRADLLARRSQSRRVRCCDAAWPEDMIAIVPFGR